VNISTAQMASTTYKGQPDDRNFSTVALADLTSAISFASTGTVGDAPAVTGDPTVHSTANAATSEASATQIPDDGSSRTSVGTIAGGVVGGVCAAGLAGLAAFFILRRKKQKKVAAVTTHTAHKSPLMQQQQQPGVGAGDYSPVPQGAAGYDVPKAPYPAPGQQTGFRPGYQTQRAIIYEAGDESATSPLYELA
jgi:phosphate/sulfate permease